MKLQPNIKLLEQALGSKDLVLFYLTWVKNEMNATKAYLELHPNVDYASARVLGSKNLALINKSMIMEAYDLGQQTYFSQLKEGVQAQKWNDFTGEREPDHNTRRRYHEALGKILGIEQDKPTVVQQINGGESMQLAFYDSTGSKVT